MIGWTVTTYGGDTVHVLELNRNGTVNGATQMLIYVTCLGGRYTAEQADAAFEKIRNETTLKDSNPDSEE